MIRSAGSFEKTGQTLRYLLALAFVVGSLLSLSAAEGDVVFRSDVSLVRVDAQVLDRDNRAITGLSSKDFVLREEGRPQEIRNFAREEMPVDVVLLLDVSASMRPHVERIASAADSALRVLGDDDRVAIMVFDRMTRLRLPFRKNRADVERELQAVLSQETFNGGTDITRGLLDAANYIRREGRREARRAIVILTDDQTERGRDEDGVSRAMTNADAVVSALLAPDAMRNRQGPPGMGGGRRGGGSWPGGSWPGGSPGGPLGGIILGRRGPYGGRMPGPVMTGPRTQSAGTAEIARRTGGDSLPVDDAAAFETTLARIRQRYALHFYLPEGVQPGQERRIEVDLSEEARRRYPQAEVRFRRVYLAPGGSGDAGAAGSEPALVRREPAATGSTAETAEPADPIETPRTRRRRGVNQVPDRPRAGPVDPADAGAQPETAPPSQGGWRRADEPEPALTEPAPKAQTPQPAGGWRRLKPGEKP